MLLKCAAATPPKTAAGRRPYSSRQRRDNGPDGSTWCGAGDETQSPKIRLLAVPATASYSGSGHRVKAMLLHSPPGPLALTSGRTSRPTVHPALLCLHQSVQTPLFQNDGARRHGSIVEAKWICEPEISPVSCHTRLTTDPLHFQFAYVPIERSPAAPSVWPKRTD